MAQANVRNPELRWPAVIAALIAIALYALLPNDVTVLPRWIAPVLAGLLLIPLIVINPRRLTRETRWSRWMGLSVGLVLAVANQVEVVLIITRLLDGSAPGSSVLLSALQVWLTDVIVFALAFWELDAGGPVKRRLEGDNERGRDFRFPQEDTGKPTNWQPGFFDYAYFALTNMMAFSPTDVMPLTTRAKALMAFQSFTGFVLLALVISRAVNILT